MNIGLVSLSGLNTRALIAFCRYTDQLGKQVHLWAKDENDPILLTKYKDWVFSTRADKTLKLDELINFLNDIKTTYGYHKVLLIPISEYFNRYILSNRSELEKAGALIPLVQKETYELISDKYSFGKLCAEHGLTVPKEMHSNALRFPAVAKPKTYASITGIQSKPHLIFNQKNWLDFTEAQHTNEFYFQEYVGGASYYLLFYIGKNGATTCLSQENIIQQADGKSIIAAQSSSIHLEPICHEYLELFEAINFHGLIMIEIKKFQDKYYMIEANPRFWGPMQLISDMGGSIFRSFLVDNGLEIPDQESIDSLIPNSHKYFWMGGLIADQLAGKDPAFHAYDTECFFNEFHTLNQADVLRRSDTVDLYMSEAEGKISS